LDEKAFDCKNYLEQLSDLLKNVSQGIKDANLQQVLQKEVPVEKSGMFGL